MLSLVMNIPRCSICKIGNVALHHVQHMIGFAYFAQISPLSDDIKVVEMDSVILIEYNL
jgi:hypothetical protein